VDFCAREFAVCESGVGSSAIASLLPIRSCDFGNWELDYDLLVCAKAEITATLSGTVIERRMDFESADLVDLSFEE
jgi:hypothetical protein